MSKVDHSVIIIPFEDIINAKIRIEATEKDEYNWIDVCTGATMLKDVAYSVRVTIEEA